MARADRATRHPTPAALTGSAHKRPPTARIALIVACLLAVATGGWLVLSETGLGGNTGRPTVQLGPERPATAMDASKAPANNSPTLRADPTDGRFVVLASRVDAPEYLCSLQLSGDGGGTWIPANPVPALPQGAEKCFGGEVAFDRHGRLYYLFVGLVGEGNEPMGVFLTSSTDRGRTFIPPRQVLGPLNFAARMAIDPTMGSHGRLHLVWLHATSDPPAGGFGPPPNPILTAHSDDGGATFSAPVQVSDAHRQRVVAPALALGSDHRVHVAYYDLLDDARDYQGLEGPVWEGKWSLILATSHDGGRTFEPGVVAEGEVTPPSRVMAIYIMPPPALAARGRLVCVGWSDGRNGDPDVLVRCSDDRARRWRPAQRVNDDPVGTGLSQYLPAVSIAEGRRVDVLFYDRRKDRQNLNNDIMYSFSTDRGRTFRQNVQLNRKGSSLAAIGVQYTVASAEGQWDFGSRLGLLSRDRDVVAAWTDTRNSAPLTTGQDIFTTVIRVQEGGRRANVAAGIGGGLLVIAGLVGLLVSARRWLPPRNRRPAQATKALLLLGPAVAVLASCSGSAEKNAAPLPPPPGIVRVTTHEYSFEVQGTLRGGRVIFEVVNAGRETHDPGLVAIDDAAPPINDLLHQTNVPRIQAFAGANPLEPGHTATYAVDISPGRRYALLCFARMADGKRHFLEGMTWETRIAE